MPEQPTNHYTRAQTIAGLRTLADYLEANPGIPIRPDGAEYTFISDYDDDASGRTEIDIIATALGEPVTDETNDGRAYTVTKSFGAVTYHAVHVPAYRRVVFHAFGDIVQTIEEMLGTLR